jgi:hypothetical protein
VLRLISPDMAPRKHKNKSAEGGMSTFFAANVSDGKKDPDSEEEQSTGQFKDLRSRPVNFAPRTKSCTCLVVGLNLMEDLSFDARHMLGSREDVNDVERPWQDNDDKGFSPRAGWMAKIMAEIFKDEVWDLVASSQRKSTISLKVLEDVKAAQRPTDLQSEAARLVSEGAQLQYLAFGKIRAGVSDAICLLKTHDTLGAITALERAKKVVDLRLDVVKKAGSVSGMWPVATLYKKRMLAETLDARNDEVWTKCLSQAGAVKAGASGGEERQASDAAGVLPCSTAAISKEATSPFEVRPIGLLAGFAIVGQGSVLRKKRAGQGSNSH